MNITATLLAQIAAFLLLIWLVNRLLSKPLGEALEKRRKQISAGLAAAKKGEKTLAEADRQSQSIIHEAHLKSEQLISHARERASAIVDDARSVASEEAERIKETAKEEMNRQLATTCEELRSQVAELAVAGAKLVVRREVDIKAHQDALHMLKEQI